MLFISLANLLIFVQPSSNWVFIGWGCTWRSRKGAHLTPIVQLDFDDLYLDWTHTLTKAYHSLGLYSKSPSPDIIGVKWKTQKSGIVWPKVLLSKLKQTFDILAFVSLYSSWGVFMHCIVEVDAINQGIQNNSFLALHLLQPGHAWTLLHTLHTIAKHIYVEIDLYMLARHCKNSCLHRF